MVMAMTEEVVNRDEVLLANHEMAPGTTLVVKGQDGRTYFITLFQNSDEKFKVKVWRDEPQGSSNCAHYQRGESCDGPDLYDAHMTTLTDELVAMDEDLRKKGFHGHYGHSHKDPTIHISRLCRRHFLESEFGLVPTKCPECGEERVVEV